MDKLEQAARQSFETWWEREGQEFLYALNTTTDDDIKLVAEVAWKNGAYCAEQAEQPVSQEYQDHLVNQSFDWAAMAAKHQFMEGYRIGLAEMREKCAKVCEELTPTDVDGVCPVAAAIRAIKFEGDTGFRPVSEMIAEHKQDPKKAAAIEKAKMRKAEQKPVAYLCPSFVDNFATGRYETCEQKDYGAFPVYAAPVRTKNLTDDEILGWIDALPYDPHQLHLLNFARAVIAADRSKNGII